MSATGGPTNISADWQDGDLIFRNSAVDPIAELTEDGLAINAAALTALTFGAAGSLTAVATNPGPDGTATGPGLYNVTSANANNIIQLPEPVPGSLVILINGATGYELRSSAPATVAINGGTGAGAESAIPASALVVCLCKTATAWAAVQIAGATLAGVEAAA